MVPVWFTGNEMPPTVMKRSHKFKVTKKDVYLSDDNLADGEQTKHYRTKKKEKVKIINC